MSKHITEKNMAKVETVNYCSSPEEISRYNQVTKLLIHK